MLFFCNILKWDALALCYALAMILILAGCSTENTSTTAFLSEDSTDQPGQNTATNQIKLEIEQASQLSIETQTIVYSTERYPVSMPGAVFPAPDNIAKVSAPITGRVTRIYAHEGERVKKGDRLLELESLSFAQLVAEYVQATADKQYNAQQVKRLEELVDKKISPKGELEKASAEHLRAEATERAIRAQLTVLGVTDTQLDAWQRGEDTRPLLNIRAPIGGTMNDHLIDLGQAVEENEMMLSIIDLNQIMVRGYLAPEEAHLVGLEDPVVIRSQSLPVRKVASTVKSVNPALDESSKSIPVNIIASPVDGWPLPGQNVQVDVMVDPGQPMLSVPLSAIQFEGNKPLVYVRLDPTTFEKREITISRLNEDHALVTDGIRDGEDVAITEVFSLKALSRFDQYGEE